MITIDFENNLINVNHTLVYYSKGKGLSNKYAINTPKTRSGKIKIPMMKKVKDALIMEKQMQEIFEIKCCD